MSKYNALWDNIAARDTARVTLRFAEISQIAGVELDHSFLTAQKELPAYGWQVGGISRKDRTVTFARLDGAEKP